jgi:hypothetical protein
MPRSQSAKWRSISYRQKPKKIFAKSVIISWVVAVRGLLAMCCANLRLLFACLRHILMRDIFAKT